MSFPRYPKYKDSGVEWLGEVPDKWDVRRLGFECDTIVPMRDKPERLDGDIPWIRIEDFTGKYIFESKSSQGVSPETVEAMNLKVLPVGTVLCSCSCSMGATAIVARPLVTNQTFIGVSSNGGYLPEYLYYMFHALAPHLNAIGTGAIQTYLSRDDFRQLRLPYPSFSEQTAIAAFLDRETAKIDALIAEQLRLIELLQEKRQAVISHAVTKGLNPDAPMKDSGIEWLGQVPEHWEVGPLKRFAISLDGRRIPLSTEERSHRKGEYPYYGASGIIDSVDDYLFDEDLVLVSEDGANLLNRSTPIAFVAHGKYWVNNHAHILKPIDGNLQYWAERIEAVDLEPFVSGSAQPKFTADELINLRIAVPPTETERAMIQEHFIEKTKAINELVIEAERVVLVLQERRSALISAAVTGQIDVRGLAASEAI